MAVSGIGSTGGFDLSKNASQIATAIVKKLDSNGDGSISKKEFVSGLTAKGISATDAAKQFDALDTSKSGKISKTDLEAAIKATGGKPAGSPPPGGPPPGGPPPAGGHSGGKSASSSTSRASSSTAKTYDKKDSNQDGTVSAAEELTYDIKHPTAKSAAQSSSQPGNIVNVNA